MKSFLALVVVALLSVLWFGSCYFFAPPGDERPNIVLIYADDLDCETVFFDWEKIAQDPSYKVNFPNIKQLADEGISFTNFHVTTPVCGPSRACLFSAKYAHRNNVRVNDPTTPWGHGFSGGFKEFDQKNEMGIWMQNAGYETALVGKYLHHGFDPDIAAGQSWKDLSPAGWDKFYAFLGGKYFDTWIADCKSDILVNTRSEYRTDAEARHCIDIIEQHNERTKSKGMLAKPADRKPMFLYWAPASAHLAHGTLPMTAPRHREWISDSMPPQLDEFLPHQASWDHFLAKDLGEFSPDELKHINEHWQDRLRAIKALDEKIGEIKAALKKANELDNTIFIFTADHGFEMGDHGHIGKRLPFDRVTRVPFLVSGKGIKHGKSCDQLLANIDIAPTLLELVGHEVPPNIDGRSFANLIDDPVAALSPPRDAIMIENWDVEWCRGYTIQAMYASMRTHSQIYTEWANGEREYYDLEADPLQFTDLYPSITSDKKDQLAKQLRSIRHEELEPVISDAIKFETEIKGHYGSISVSGFAEAHRGIEKLELEIFDRIHRTYWDGENWTSGEALVIADLAQENGLISQWRYQFDPAATQSLPPQEVDLTFSVKVTDFNSKVAWKRDVHVIECQTGAPETWIDETVKDFPTQLPLLLTGRAIDNEEVKEVQICFYDLMNKTFWDGKKWGPENVTISVATVPGSEPDSEYRRFSYLFDEEVTSDIFVSVRAFDNRGNFDKTVASRTILKRLLKAKSPD